jgi:hypothetical protein
MPKTIKLLKAMLLCLLLFYIVYTGVTKALGEVIIAQFEPFDFQIVEAIPSSLAFKEAVFSTEPQLVGREDADWTIRVPKGEGGWRLYATVSEVCLADGEEVLAANLAFILGGEMLLLPKQTETLIATGEGKAVLCWPEEEGFHLYLQAGAGYPGETYALTILWRIDYEE